MTLHLKSIEWIRDHEYEVTVDMKGNVVRCVCRVAERHGSWFVQPTPDLFATLPVPPRLLVAAVLAIEAINAPQPSPPDS